MDCFFIIKNVFLRYIKTLLMKTMLYAFFLMLFAACAKTENAKDEVLAPTDAMAVAAMKLEVSALQTTAHQLSGSTEQQTHLDSSYHHHDSLFWHHHAQYNHANHNTHIDHHHQWVAYDPHVDHSHHYHPVYPGHPHDSLVVIPNGHHPATTASHPDIHTIQDHHSIDSLHRLHHRYH